MKFSIVQAYLGEDEGFHGKPPSSTQHKETPNTKPKAPHTSILPNRKKPQTLAPPPPLKSTHRHSNKTASTEARTLKLETL